MNLELLIDILKEFKNFEESTSYKSTAKVEDFQNFLNERSYGKENPTNLSDKYDLKVYDLENEIAKQVIMLGRYSKHLIKKALEKNTDLVNDDFTYLFRLMDYDSLTKTQLIEKNAHEKQSGIEIIKRLVKNGLISEKPDAEDKRSVRVAVTPKGKEVFFETMKDITVVSKIMSGKLNEKEKNNLLMYLKKINTFHHTVYLNLKNEELEDIRKLVS
ncbi:MarR family winged helix-turn-helix transcriptional regulator [Chryseobacterium sp. MP_3.2]|uniref:MarR family winged helix-turn-helix transcriptional regulator n=1 Tax=Chryseobacterium sp. MP_3.2 TaxID=3071712 RepID=UPI002E04018E|nr:DNA-binding MarR family transcriptional regulator [Chryseobacterium sp. MP_3.2]